MSTTRERDVLECLNSIVQRSLQRDEIRQAIARIRERLARDRDLRIAWETVPLQLYESLPAEVRSAWVFALRAGSTTGAERHPNSRQRVMSIIGSADLQVWDGSAWASHRLTSRNDAGVLERWLSIPPATWHRPVVDPAHDWFVMSFHTAEANQLIEELASNDETPDEAATETNLYAGRLAR